MRAFTNSDKIIFSVNALYGLYDDISCNPKTILDYLQYLHDSNGTLIPRYRLLYGAFQSKYETHLLLYKFLVES